MKAAPSDRLDSWKQIASYLRRSVRTVRRWEQGEGLPVHRHPHRALASVYALRSEVDAWLHARSHDPEPVAARPAAPALEPARSIAVLPFANLSAEPENAYFAAGLTEELTTRLSMVRSLRVISRASASALGGAGRGSSGAAAQLGVRYLLQGSVRRAGARLRIAARLVDAASDHHLWADSFDGTLDDVFTFQEQLARQIVEALQLRLSADERQHLAERSIDNVPAYDCYLRARHEAWRWRKDSIDHAVELLQQALAIIGENAQLHAALGFAHLQYREAGIDLGEQPLLAAEHCAAKVFALQAESAAGLRLRGWIRYARGLVQPAVGDLGAALEAEPNNADTLLLLSNCYLISGRVSAARPLLARLTAVDPLTPLTRCMPAWAGILEGHVQAAVGPYRQMFEMDSANPMARLFYAWVLILNGRADELLRVVEATPQDLRDTVPSRIAAFLTFAFTGRRRQALESLTPQVEAAAAVTDLFARMLAQGYTMLAMPEPALHWLRVAVDRGFINHPYLARHDPLFEPLRGDARFQALLELVHERWQRFEA